MAESKNNYYDCIAPHLYQGSNPPTGDMLHRLGFEYLVLCAREHQLAPRFYPGLREVIYAPMDDGAFVQVDVAYPAARRVARLVRAGHKVLVVCHRGRNRSGLVSALALWYLTGRPGMDCLWRVQAARPNALTNKAFAMYIGLLPARTRSRKAA